MPFVPDQEQPKASGRFVPDAAASPAPTSVKEEAKPSMMASLLTPEIAKIPKGAYGLAEAGTQMLTGMGASAVGGIEGINKLLSGGTVDQAAERVRAVQDKYTYQPKTAEGEVTSKAAALPIEYAGKLGAFMGRNSGIAELTGTQLGAEMIGEKAPEAIATILMGRAGLNKAANRPNVTGTAQDPYLKSQAARESVANAGVIDAGRIANQYGIAIDPRKVNPSVKNKVTESFVKANDKAEALTKANVGRPEQALKLDVGIAAETPLSLESIRAARDAAGGSRATIQQMGGFTDDGSVSQAIARLQPARVIGDEAAQKVASNLIDRAITDIQNGMSGADVLRNIEQLRKEARDIRKGTDLGPEKMAMAKVREGISRELEGLIDQNLQRQAEANPALGKLLDQYKQDRATQAKTYTLEDIFNENTGKVDMGKLAKLTAEDNALTGPFADLGKVAGVFPESFSSGGPLSTIQRHLARSGVPAAIGMGVGTVLAPGMGTLGGAVAGAGLGEMASILGARRIASPGYQSKNAIPVDARPMRQALGYEKTPVGPEPLSLAPVGEPLVPPTPQGPVPQGRGLIGMADEGAMPVRAEPQMPSVEMPIEGRLQPMYQRGGIPEESGLSLIPKSEGLKMPEVQYPPAPEGRGLLSLADEQVAAIKNRGGAERPPVDFMGKTEFWQQKPMVEATEAFLRRAEELRSIINNKYPIDGRKQAAAAMELQALEKEFGAGAKLGGLRGKSDAYSALYQAGDTQLPIQKTFDPRITAAILGRK
jgi:hypothetical protein